MPMANAAIATPPILREGDRLTSAEFLQRWEAMPDLKLAELIDGVVFMPSPVGLSHATVVSNINAWLWLYKDATPGCQSTSDATWVMGPTDVPQPDAVLRVLPEHGGHSGEAGGYGKGAPELIVEVSGSTLSRDLGIKLELYRKAGVREYITILLKPQRVIWRELSRGRYRDIDPSEDGLLRAHYFPGLWLDPQALWDPKQSLRPAIEQGIQTPGHAAFVRRLAKPRRRK